MAITEVSNDGVGRIGAGTGVSALEDYGQGFSLGGGSQAGGEGDTSTIPLNWRGMTLEDFSAAAAQAGLDPVADADVIEAAFQNAAGADGLLSGDEFMAAFQDAMIPNGDLGNAVEVDNAAFRDRIESLAAGDPASGSPTAADPSASSASPNPAGSPPPSQDPASCNPAEAQGASPVEGASAASEPTGESLLGEADKDRNGVLSPDEIRDLVGAVSDPSAPPADAAAMAEQLMQQLGGPEGIPVEALDQAIDAVGGDLSSKEGLREALADIAAGEASPQSENQQGEAERRSENRSAAAQT